MTFETMSSAETEVEPNRVLTIGSPAESWLDTVWGESGLPKAVSNRLKRIEEKIQGLHGIMEVLHRDARNQMEAQAFDDVEYQPLQPTVVEGLIFAQSALMTGVTEELEGLRELVKKYGAQVLR
jgi:hypothetical protein